MKSYHEDVQHLLNCIHIQYSSEGDNCTLSGILGATFLVDYYVFNKLLSFLNW